MATIGYPGFAKKMVETKKYGAAFAAGKRTASRGAALRATARKTISAGAKGDWYQKTLGISKKAAGGIGLGIMLAMMVKNIVGQEIGTSQTMGMQNIQAEHMREMGGMEGEDTYYAAALPELRAERQMAQQALMQMIMGGQGMPMMPMQVPGERVIGGGGGY